MKSFNDLSPEEQEARQQKVIVLLRKVYRTPGAEYFTEQAKAKTIARVQQRLAEMEHLADTRPEALHREGTNVTRTSSLCSNIPLRDPMYGKRLVQTLAAVLVVGILIGATIVLFALRQQSMVSGSQTTVSKPTGAPTSMNIETGGLKMALSVTAGPYFLSELVAADMTLSNPTQTSYHTEGDFTTNPCTGGALHARLLGGNSPSFFIPAEHFSLRCPPPDLSILPPGQTRTVRQYVPLERSGKVTLEVESQFAPTTSPASESFPAHWLTLQLTVAPQVPANRTLSVQQGSDLQITVPQVVHPQLAYISTSKFMGPVICGNYEWQPITTTILRAPDPSCITKQGGPMSYAVGAVGYAVVTGTWNS